MKLFVVFKWTDIWAKRMIAVDFDKIGNNISQRKKIPFRSSEISLSMTSLVQCIIYSNLNWAKIARKMDTFIQLLNAVGKRVYELNALKTVKKKQKTHTQMDSTKRPFGAVRRKWFEDECRQRYKTMRFEYLDR